ncbi:MAG: hypothetical protein ACFNVO_05085 [Prevotella sp.]
MNRKRWKQPKIIGKRSDDRLGFNRHSGYGNWHNRFSLLFVFAEKGSQLPQVVGI